MAEKNLYIMVSVSEIFKVTCENSGSTCHNTTRFRPGFTISVTCRCVTKCDCGQMPPKSKTSPPPPAPVRSTVSLSALRHLCLRELLLGVVASQRLSISRETLLNLISRLCQPGEISVQPVLYSLSVDYLRSPPIFLVLNETAFCYRPSRD